MNDTNEKPADPCARAWTLALYRNLEHGFVIESQYYGEDDTDFHRGYVRLSEPAEVRFSPVRDDTLIQNAVAAYDAMEREVLAECNKRVIQIRQQKANLLALTHQPAPAE